MPCGAERRVGVADEADSCADWHAHYDPELDGNCDGLGWSDDEELAAVLAEQYAQRRARQRGDGAAQAVKAPPKSSGVLGGCDADGG